MRYLIDKSFFLATSMTIPECIAKLERLSYQGGSSATKRYNRVRSTRIDEETKTGRLVAESKFFSKPHAEAIVHLHDLDGATVIEGEVRNIINNNSAIGIFFLILCVIALFTLFVSNLVYILLFIMFAVFSVIGYIYSTFAFQLMLLDTIKQNLNAEVIPAPREKR
jgi:predicted RND superfamily exporter protein